MKMNIYTDSIGNIKSDPNSFAPYKCSNTVKQKVFKSYLQRVTSFSKEMTEVLKPIAHTQPIIAGGVFRSLYEGKNRDWKDIDLFFQTKEQRDKALDVLFNLHSQWFTLNSGYHITNTYNSDISSCFRIVYLGKTYHIEIVKKYINKPEELLRSFDFNLTKTAIFGEGFQQFATSTQCLIDLELKKLTLDAPITKKTETFLRMIRYLQYGYTITNAEALCLLEDIVVHEPNVVQIINQLQLRAEEEGDY